MISSLSFLIFATDVLSLFSLFSFARGSSFLLIYLKRHPSVLLIFSSFVSCIIYCCRHAWEPLWLATAHLRRLGLRGASVTGSSRAVVGGQLGRGLSRSSAAGECLPARTCGCWQPRAPPELLEFGSPLDRGCPSVVFHGGLPAGRLTER